MELVDGLQVLKEETLVFIVEGEGGGEEACAGGCVPERRSEADDKNTHQLSL